MKGDETVMFRYPERPFPVHRGIRLWTMFLLLMLGLSFLFPASAASGVTGLTVESHPANDRYLTVSFDFTAGGKTYAVFITGIRAGADPSSWAKPLAEKVAESYTVGKHLRISTRSTGKPDEYVISGVDLMDAEKQNRKEVNWDTDDVPSYMSDSQLCWAAGASNALELSGWGRVLTDLNPGKVDFQNEDDIFAYFAGNVMDTGYRALDGHRWILTGLNVDQKTDPDTGEPEFGHFFWKGPQLWKAGTGGLAKDYCPTDVVSRDYDSLRQAFIDRLSSVGLRDGADLLEKGYGVSMGLEFEDNFGSGHDLCLAGTVREKASGDVVAVILADSDNDAPVYEYGDTAAEQAAGPRSERVNSLDMYTIREMGEKGKSVLRVENYWMYPDTTLISDVTTVKPFSMGLPKETEGTRDVYADPDMVPQNVRVGYNRFGFSDEIVGTPVYLDTSLNNQSYVRLTEDPSATVTLRYIIYKDGVKVDSFTKDVLLTEKQLFPLSLSTEGTDVYYTFREPGEYMVGAEVIGIRDSKGSIREAYTRNNMVKNAKVTVTAVSPMPPTGDSTPVLLLFMALACSLVTILFLFRKQKKVSE